MNVAMNFFRFCWAVALGIGAALSAAGASRFDERFEDRTLRLDYVFGADSLRRYVLLDRMTTSQGWAGRRTNLDSLPYAGDGTITLVDIASGDTIYRHSFSSLFHEWLSTAEARSTPRAFHNSYLVPQPREKARITVCLTDQRRREMARMTHDYDPAEVLIERRDGIAPLPHRYLHRSPLAADRAIDVAILAEGYTAAETDSFYCHARRAVDAILSHEPFRRMADRFNFVAVASTGRDSGVSVPRTGDWRRTPFSSHFSTFHSDRYLTTDRIGEIHDALTGIPYEHIIILANTDEYGGGGIYNSYTLTTARHKNFRPVVVHEFGHSFGGLADEYFYEGDIMEDSYPADVEPWNPNITTLVDFSSKWKGLLRADTPVPTPVDHKEEFPVGVYEGGGYSSKGVYRPADECRMRNNTYPTFCGACQAALARLIEFYTGN